jgi:hypothetical protein
MKYFLIGNRPVRLSEKDGLVEVWSWKQGKMIPAPGMMPAVTLGVGADGEPMDIEQVSAEQFKAAVEKAGRPKLLLKKGESHA